LLGVADAVFIAFLSKVIDVFVDGCTMELGRRLRRERVMEQRMSEMPSLIGHTRNCARRKTGRNEFSARVGFEMRYAR
jgi:hypothetical protein